MRISVYAIYVVACLLASVAAGLSGFVLINTFNKQLQDSENTQLRSGLGQVSAMQAVIENQMDRMRTVADANARIFFYQTSALPRDAYEPKKVLAAINGTVFSNYVPALAAPKQLNGFGVAFIYTNETTGRHYDRSLEMFWSLQMTGEYLFSYAASSEEDNLLHARQMVFENYSNPVLGDEIYAYRTDLLLANTYVKDDFFDSAKSWISDDGNSYWYFTYLRAFTVHSIPMSLETWDVASAWLAMMRSILTPGANFVAFDSQKYVMAATTAAEAERLANCRGAYTGSSITGDCISLPADQHPTQEIRDIYIALYSPSWDDLLAGPIASTMTPLMLNGQKHMAISSTLFSKDNFRTIVVWYQPWVTLASDYVALTALVCFLTVFSTFVLTALGVFGILRPLMALGSTMRFVTQKLKDGDGEREAVLEPRRPSVFHEVEAIGKDFETIVVDFLGFSSANARDNTHAPKDPDRPFAVLFTDIQSSTELWSKDPAEMSRCLQIHHRLIRQLIRKHNLYEVKTVGDSFMVTTTSSLDALRFALDLQLTFQDYYWDWDGAEELYQEATKAFDRSTRGSLIGTEYTDLWNGLRVRIGAHYGAGKVTYDEVSKGYDYYGSVVNTAARIEAAAHGGQVVVSEALLKALPVPLDPGVGVLVPLGTVPLRGVAEPPQLVEVKPLALQGRRFPALRLDHAEDVPLVEKSLSASCVREPSRTLVPSPRHGDRCISGGSLLSHSDGASTLNHTTEDLARGHAMVLAGRLPAELLAHHLLALHHVVEDLLKPLAPQNHATVAKLLATGWGLPAPRSRADFSHTVIWLVHRMSETTKVLHHFLLPPPTAPAARTSPAKRLTPPSSPQAIQNHPFAPDSSANPTQQ